MCWGTWPISLEPPWAGIYAPGEPDVIAQAVIRLAYVSCPYFLCGIMDTMVGVLRGLGYSVVPMVASLIGACGLRLVWVAVMFPISGRRRRCMSPIPSPGPLRRPSHILFFLFVRKRAYAGSGATGAPRKRPRAPDAPPVRTEE